MRWLIFVTCWTFILGWTWRVCVVNGDVVIIRKVNKKDVLHRDRFNIRRSKCTDIRQGNKCGHYGGFERSPHNPCKCHCPPKRGTIILRNNRWRCTSNEDLREQQGCGLYFTYESSDSFVKITNGKRWQYFHAPSATCTLDKISVSFLSCNGSWVKFPNMDHYVNIWRQGYDQVARGYAYQFRIRKNRLLEGKLLKLDLSCISFGGKSCILMKMKGTQNCFRNKRPRNRIKIRKNNHENGILPVSSITTPSTRLVFYNISNMTSKTGSILEKWEKYNLTKTQVRSPSTRKDDMKVTTVILTVTAVFLGLIVLGLGINLCFCSTLHESYKEKHIFHRIHGHHCPGTHRLRTSDVTRASHSLSLVVEVSSLRSMSLYSSIDGGSRDTICISQNGIS